MGTQYKKVLEDLLEQLSKTVMVILSITLGVFALGLILDTYQITDREMSISYNAVNPASFVITVENHDANIMEVLRANKNIDMAEPRQMIVARCSSTTNEWKECKLSVIEDWENVQVNTIVPKEGRQSPKVGEILLESSSLSVVNSKVGDLINVKLPNGQMAALKIAGTVQADGTNPAWMHEKVLGYMNKETMSAYFPGHKNCSYLIKLTGKHQDMETITTLANDVKASLTTLKYQVSSLSVPKPYIHPNASQMNAILLLFRIFGILALLLSSILVYSVVSSILKGQIRQIAVMKAMGATTAQIVRMYYLFVIILGTVSALLSIPAAKILSDSLCAFTASILVFTIRDTSVPVWIYLIQMLIAIGIPVLAASVPIINACVAPVAVGLNDRVSLKFESVSKPLQKLFDRISHQKAGIALGLSNTFRSKEKLLLSVITLGVGGAILISSINIRVSVEQSFSQSLEQYQMDTQFTLEGTYSKEDLQAVLKSVKGIKHIELSMVTYASLFEEEERGKTNLKYDNSSKLTVLSVKHTESANLKDTFRETEETLQKNGCELISATTIKTAETIYQKHLLTIASFLIGASVLVILVGIISLISLAGISVAGRRKEIGIMRSFGTNTTSLFTSILIENIYTGILGVVLAIGASLPLSSIIGSQFGKIFLGKALPQIVSIKGVVLWFILTILINTFVSFTSVRKLVSVPVTKLIN